MQCFVYYSDSKELNNIGKCSTTQQPSSHEMINHVRFYVLKRLSYIQGSGGLPLNNEKHHFSDVADWSEEQTMKLLLCHPNHIVQVGFHPPAVIYLSLFKTSLFFDQIWLQLHIFPCLAAVTHYPLFSAHLSFPCCAGMAKASAFFPIVTLPCVPLFISPRFCLHPLSFVSGCGKSFSFEIRPLFHFPAARASSLAYLNPAVSVNECQWKTNHLNPKTNQKF